MFEYGTTQIKKTGGQFHHRDPQFTINFGTVFFPKKHSNEKHLSNFKQPNVRNEILRMPFGMRRAEYGDLVFCTDLGSAKRSQSELRVGS